MRFLENRSHSPPAIAITIRRETTVSPLRVPMMISLAISIKWSLSRFGLPERFERELSFLVLHLPFQEFIDVRFKLYLGKIFVNLLRAACVPFKAANLPISNFTFSGTV